MQMLQWPVILKLYIIIVCKICGSKESHSTVVIYLLLICITIRKNYFSPCPAGGSKPVFESVRVLVYNSNNNNNNINNNNNNDNNNNNLK